MSTRNDLNEALVELEDALGAFDVDTDEPRAVAVEDKAEDVDTALVAFLADNSRTRIVNRAVNTALTDADAAVIRFRTAGSRAAGRYITRAISSAQDAAHVVGTDQVRR